MAPTQLADVGNLTLVLSLAVSIYIILASLYSLRANKPHFFVSAENGVYLVAGLTTFAVLLLEYALITRQFRIEYVAEHVSSDQPLLYTISALWGGQAGSLLFWAWLLAVFSALALVQNRAQNRQLVPYVAMFLAFTEAFFLLLVVMIEPPFKLLDFVPRDGKGLNPLLQNPGMFIHPVTLYLGYVGFTIPFAFAIAALATGKLNDAWIRTTRRWSLVAWLFLSLGLLFGMRWAYVVLGWGGYWGWDPVENAALIPWLTGTAYLHSVMIQEKRGMLKVWNLVLIMLTFILSVLGTFLTRSGVVQSVHAFGVGQLGPFFLGFIGLVVLTFLFLLYSRLDQLKEENELHSVVSREATFLLNNLILVGAAFATLWGTIFPMISEIVTGNQISVAAPFFNQVNGPIFLGLTLLMGVCTMIGWRRATPENLIRNFSRPFIATILVLIALFVIGVRDLFGLMAFGSAAFAMGTLILEFYRGDLARVRQYEENPVFALYQLVKKNRRRYGGYIVHLGIVFAAIGIAGSMFYQTEMQQNLKPGETMTVKQYALKFEGLKQFGETNRDVVSARMSVFENGKPIGILSPEKDYYRAADQTTTEVAIRSTPLEDLYLILGGWTDDGTATIKVFINPLVMWLWVGFGVFIAGTLIAALPDPREATVVVRSRAREAVSTA
ncbi:MAG: heme lyase CcmF/NrfE family subunit [Chloroflexi bacterium]|nr:heme lyase CcmF/NrfE family subunit [Chloroflexota bacterium]